MKKVRMTNNKIPEEDLLFAFISNIPQKLPDFFQVIRTETRTITKSK